jgi:hypothetical protein
MPYSPPSGGAVNFSFITHPYVVPSGDAVNFNIGVLLGVNARMQFACEWDTIPASAQVMEASSAWQTIRVGRNLLKLGCAYSTSRWWQTMRAAACWLTNAANHGTVPLQPSYVVLVNGNAKMRTAAAWNTNAFTTARLLAGAEWETKIYSTKQVDMWFFWSYLMDVQRGVILVIADEVARAVELDSRMVGDSVVKAITLHSTMGEVQRGVTLPSPLFTDVQRGVTLDAAMRSDVQRGVELPSPLLTVTSIVRAINLPSPLMNSASVLPVDEAYATIDGTRVELLSVDVNASEGQLGWVAHIELKRITDYDLFKANSLFTVTTGGEDYAMLFDGKQKPRAGLTDKNALVNGISPCAKYATPRGAKITKTWTAPILASALAAELFPGTAIDWRILDWSVPAPRLSAQNEVPASIMQRVLAATGAVLEAAKDGSFIVRYRYPVSVPQYVTHTPDHVYTDADHNFSTNEGVQLAQLVNKIRIMDVATAGFSDRMEFTPDAADATRGVLKVWPSPWRETFNVEHTSLPIVSVERVGVRTEQLTETIEIVNGKGSVSKPVFSVDSLTWLYDDLGGVVADSDSSQLVSTSTALFDSLLTITYTTRYVEYNARAYTGAKVQFVVREPTA